MAQVSERGYWVKEVADRFGISTKALYTWMAQFSKPQRATDQEAEVRCLKKELARVTEERNIQKRRPRTSPWCLNQWRKNGSFIDLFSRRVVGWAIQSRQASEIAVQEPRISQARRLCGHRTVLQPEAQAHEQRHAVTL